MVTLFILNNETPGYPLRESGVGVETPISSRTKQKCSQQHAAEGLDCQEFLPTATKILDPLCFRAID